MLNRRIWLRSIPGDQVPRWTFLQKNWSVYATCASVFGSMTRNATIVRNTLFVLTFLFWANHCLVCSAFASEARAKEHKSAPCHHDDGASQSSDNGQSHCGGQACCGPILEPANASLSSLAASVTLSLLLPLDFLDLSTAVENLLSLCVSSLDSTGPPRLSELPRLAHSLAPNAPPLS